MSGSVVAFASGVLSGFDSKPITVIGGQHLPSVHKHTLTHIQAHTHMIAIKLKSKNEHTFLKCIFREAK